MKRMKKLISIMLCFLLVISMFTACKKGDTVEDTNSPVITEAPADSAGDLKEGEPTIAPTDKPVEAITDAPLELTLGIWPEAGSTEQIALHEGYVSAFNTIHPDIKVVPAHYFYSPDTISTMEKAGILPVIFEPYFADTQKLIESGYVADITDILQERGWLEAINPSMKELMSKDGRTYGIPNNTYALGLMLNIALFKEAGLVDADGLPVYPKTWAELAETGKKIKEATGKAGFCLLAEDNAAGWQFCNIAWGFGASLITKNADGTLTSNLNSPEAIEAMEYVKALKWEYDILTPDPTVENYITGFSQLGTGEAAMYIAASDVVYLPTSGNGLPAKDLSLVPIPAGPASEQYSIFDGTLFMFSKDATEAQINAALDYITIMGNGPELDMSVFEADCKDRSENGIPVICRFPNWVNQTRLDQETALITKYSNIDMRLYQDYFNFVKLNGKLRLEECGDALYQELIPVIQAVITDENADVTALMKVANDNYQKKLDAR